MSKDIELNNLTATEFLNEINKKREELISQNIIKKTNSTTISENEQPYKIPAEWLWVRLGDIGEIASSKRVYQAQWREEGIPFIRARDIVKLNSTEEYNPELFIEEELYNKFKEKFGVPKINDILITGIGTTGESYIVKDNDPFYFKDASIIWFKNHFSLEPKFIKYYLDFPKTKLMIQNMSGGTTVATYTISGASSTPIPFPPLKEQQKIAEILSSVDAAIEKTEQVIAKTEEVKKGLMQQFPHKDIITTLLNISKKIEIDQVKCNKLKQIKQGLMQQLLTGQVRVKV